MYNLPAGYAFFFEDDAADVVGVLLDAGRGGAVTLGAICGKTGFSSGELSAFLSQLTDAGLVSSHETDEHVVEAYRDQLKAADLKPDGRGNLFEQLTVSQSDAEKAYLRRTGVLVGAAMLELTYTCSERCIHCYNPGATRNDSEKSGRIRAELGLDDYKRIIDDLYDNGLFKVCLTGGDPFSKEGIWDIIDYLYSKEIATEIFTNGQRLLGNEQRLASYFPSDVGVSVYAPSARIHDRVTRVPGSYVKSLKVLDSLRAFCIPTVIKCTLMRQTVKYYPAMFDLAAKYHAELQVECRLFDGLDGDKSVSRHLRLMPEELYVVFRDPRLPFYVGEELPSYGAEPLDMEHIACRAGVGNITVTPEGYMIPCCSFHAVLGNLRSGDVLSELTMNPMYEKLLTTPLSSYDECGGHDYCAFCKMCPGLNYSENGTPLKPAENNCFIAKSRFAVAQMLQRGEDPLDGRSLESALASLPDFSFETISREMGTSHFNTSLNL